MQRGIIREFFDGRRGGVFVDVGSAHYRDRSMTFFLEEEFGWSGIAVDALEHFAADPSYRPVFRSRWFFSLLGAVMCLWLMFKMSAA